LKFLLAFTRARFDSQLTLKLFRAIIKYDHRLAVEVRPIQSNLRFFFTNKKAHVFERSCTVSQDGVIGPIFEGDMPPKNDPKSGAVNDTITGCQFWSHFFNSSPAISVFGKARLYFY
jgi:hypothetical protein